MLWRPLPDPRHPRTIPAREAVPPFLNFAPPENGFAALERTARAYDEALAHASENGGDALARAPLREVNARPIAIEPAMTLHEGLPNRDWFKHQIYAPGYYTGYGVKTLPAVRESIERKDWKLAEEQIVRVGKCWRTPVRRFRAPPRNWSARRGSFVNERGAQNRRNGRRSRRR